jgi:hypothetical protein
MATPTSATGTASANDPDTPPVCVMFKSRKRQAGSRSRRNAGRRQTPDSTDRQTRPQEDGENINGQGGLQRKKKSRPSPAEEEEDDTVVHRPQNKRWRSSQVGSDASSALSPRELDLRHALIHSLHVRMHAYSYTFLHVLMYTHDRSPARPLSKFRLTYRTDTHSLTHSPTCRSTRQPLSERRGMTNSSNTPPTQVW